ncbi:MAG: glycosyltransferase [Sulfuricurvum sp.]|nr:glycosyltransferase [Sulfuricurvum sp.]
MSTKQPTAIICLSHHSGGMEIDSIKLAKKLSAHVPITLIAKTNCFIANSKDDYAGYNNIELETISFRSSMSLSIVLGVRRIVQDKGIKNIIFFGASELKSLYFSFLGLDINLIVRHGTTKSRPKKDWFHRLIYSNVNTHISICKHLQKNVEHIIPFGKQTKSVMIYPSLELSKIEKAPHDTLTLIHVGRIAKGKGQADAIQACEILHKKGIDFIFYLVGGFDARYEQPFMELYNSLPYKEKIILVGFTKNVSEYYAKADIFLFPSHGEGLSNAFLEALANNLVCITYNNTSFPELQKLGLYCHLCDNRNIESVKNTLLESGTHLSEEISSASANRQIIEHIFNTERVIRDYLTLLK